MSTLATLPVTSPFSGELVGEAPVSSPAQNAEALDAAARAGSPPPRPERARVLHAVADRLADESPEWGRLISPGSGLCLKDTRHEVGRAVDVFRFAAIEALRDDGETFAGDVSERGRDRRAHTLRVPVSVVAAITPFNHPLNQVVHKVAPAIAAGAPIVLKPSERTPLAAVRLQQVLLDAGVPLERARIVCGEPGAILDAFLAHPAVEVISFTGGVAVGKEIARRLGYRRAVLELGGNDPLIVLADADLEEAARLAVSGAFANSGQRCSAIKHILAVPEIADELAERIGAGAATLRCGDPLDEEPTDGS